MSQSNVLFMDIIRSLPDNKRPCTAPRGRIPENKIIFSYLNCFNGTLIFIFPKNYQLLCHVFLMDKKKSYCANHSSDNHIRHPVDRYQCSVFVPYFDLNDVGTFPRWIKVPLATTYPPCACFIWFPFTSIPNTWKRFSGGTDIELKAPPTVSAKAILAPPCKAPSGRQVRRSIGILASSHPSRPQ